jgi:3-oxoacyl-[acyl-carrier-protein] synthase-1
MNFVDRVDRMEPCITGMGAVTAVGLTAVQTASSVRAGISRFSDHPYHWSLIDPPYLDEPERLTCAPVAFIDALERAPDRLLNMALAPLEELFSQGALRREDLKKAGMFLATSPEVDGIGEWGLERTLIPEIFRRAAVAPFRVARVERAGATGFYRLLLEAKRALTDGVCRFALVGGVDTWLDEPSVRHFDAAYRLRSARNRDGFIPGEGAAWLLVETIESAAGRNAPILGIIGSVILSLEEQPLTGEQNSTGKGLTEAVRDVLSSVENDPDWVVCDLNGESYRSYEWGLVRTRLGSDLESIRALWHPADCLGDLRAAGPPVHMALACEAFRRGYAPGSTCLSFAGADEGERAACLVVRPTEEE